MTTSDGFYLGEHVDPSNSERTGDRMVLDPDGLTTHGIIVGMTGSGKTGLGVVLLEEAARAGLPTLIIDPKGDMGNLALRFPDLTAAEFRPWVTEEEAKRAGTDVDTFAVDQSELWSKGLADWGLGGGDIRALRNAADVTIYTPGSSAGVPVNVLGSLAAPSVDYDANAEILGDEIEGLVLGLLRLAGIEADPITSHEHILLASIVQHMWRNGHGLDLATLIGLVQRPPMRRLGVFDVESFYPQEERQRLALRLNGLVAAPSFAAWLGGMPLDIPSLLWTQKGEPRAAIFTLSHLNENERQFVVTLLLSKVATWMHSLQGTGDLRALIYMDEVFGYAPPTAEPPSKKPILTLLKQARAFGIGLVLATQNPVDLDYKAISNAGTWFIGRLQTERDRNRLLDGMSLDSGIDKGDLDNRIAGLAKRQFVVHRSGAEPAIFQTRWSMSYLRGPLSRNEISSLRPEWADGLGTSTVDATGQTGAGTSAARAGGGGSDDSGAGARDDAHSTRNGSIAATPSESGDRGRVKSALASDESVVAPTVASGVEVRYLDAAAPWADAIGAKPGGNRLQAGLVARVRLVFDELNAGVDHREEWEAVIFPLAETFDPREARSVDYDARDFEPAPPRGATYVLPVAPINTASFFRSAETALKNALHADRTVEVFRNAELKAYSRVGEAKEDFALRCDSLAEDGADAEASKLREQFETKLRRIQTQIRQVERKVEELDEETSARGRDEILTGAGAVLSAFLGGRSRTRSLATGISGASRRRRMTSAAKNRLETAVDKFELLSAEMQALEDELAETLVDIDLRWSDRAQEIEVMEIGLEKTDITVEEIALVWVPTS